MNTLNKILARWGYQISLANAAVEQTLLQLKYSELEVQYNDLREQNKELKRKLACRTAGEWYWRKQAKEARGE